MTVSAGKAKIEVSADLDRLRRDMRSIGTMAASAGRSAGSKFSSSFSSMASRAGRSIATGIRRGLQTAAVAMVAWAGYSVNAAADVEESINKASVVFGKNRREILKWSKSTAKAMGISRQQSLEAAAGFGNVMNASGVAGDQVGGMSKKMVGLAADMASFNNIDPTEALEKLRAGLVGEAEPLRQVGVLLSETRVKAEAYASGIAEQGEELTDAQKVQARYNLILKDTTKQQGDFARTSESAPNQIRTLKATFSDLSSELGKRLLPFGVKVLTWANENLPKAFKWLEKTGIPNLVKAWDWVVEGIGNAMSRITDVIATFIEFWTNAAGKILAGAAFAFGWIPGIGEKIREARDDFNRWSDGVVANLRHQADVFQTWGDGVGETLANAKADWEGFKMAVEKGVLPPQAGFSWVPPNSGGSGGGGGKGGKGGTTMGPPSPLPSDYLVPPKDSVTQFNLTLDKQTATRTIQRTAKRNDILLGIG